MPCSICYESFTNTKVFELKCEHVLHYDCLKLLIKSRNRKCPLCRHPIRYTVKQLYVTFHPKRTSSKSAGTIV